MELYFIESDQLCFIEYYLKPVDPKPLSPLAVHCPAMIFPWARKIIADATQDGGFQPLMIDPIDFGTLYQKKLSEAKAQEIPAGSA